MPMRLQGRAMRHNLHTTRYTRTSSFSAAHCRSRPTSSSLCRTLTTLGLLMDRVGRSNRLRTSQSHVKEAEWCGTPRGNGLFSSAVTQIKSRSIRTPFAKMLGLGTEVIGASKQLRLNRCAATMLDSYMMMPWAKQSLSVATVLLFLTT